jgi:hypothetical protein
MASVYERYYERQPDAVKIIAVAGVALLGYSLYRRFRTSQDIKEANQAAALATSELQQLAQQGVTPSYSLSQFENFSQTIVTAIDGCGTDEDAIYSVFGQMNNEADIRQLVATFGVRYTQPCAASSPISYTIWLANDKAFGGPLGVFLRFDLSDSEISHVNSILRTRGINYQF